MRIAVVLNTKAGTLLAMKGGAEDIAEHMRKSGLDAYLEPDDERSLPERIRAAVASGADAIVVGGGDGTIACAAQELTGTDVALGIIPLGTANLLAKDLKIPLDPVKAIEAIETGVVREIDAGEVNGQIFLCNSVLGLPALLAQQREKVRGTRAKLATAWTLLVAALRWYWRYPALRMAIDVGRGTRVVRTHMLAVVDNDYDEGFGQVLTRSHLDRGELVVYIARDLTMLGTLWLAIRMFLGSWRNVRDLERHAVRDIVIDSSRHRLRVMLDGEVRHMEPPLRYRIRPRALRVIVPPDVEGLGTPGGEPQDARQVA